MPAGDNARTGVKLAFWLSSIAAVLLAASFFLYFAHALFLKYPPPWPDESIFADPATSLLHQGVPATDVFSGLLPGATRCTFLQPPLYFLFLWLVFSIGGVSLVALRLASLALGVVAAALTYVLGDRSGLGRCWALFPVALLLLDTAFLRGSLIGRMDMMALVLILLALVLDAEPRPLGSPPGKTRTFLTGLVCGLAALTHPIGAAASVAVGFRHIAYPESPRRRALPHLLAGILTPVAFWGAYILPHWRDFMAQFGGQILTKAGRQPLVFQHLRHTFRMFVGQYGSPGNPAIGLVWLAGLVGLFFSARKRTTLSVLPACQLVIMGVAIWGKEMWYVVYLAPLTAIGLAHIILLARERRVWTKTLGWIGVLLALWFAQQCALSTYAVNYALNINNQRVTHYFEWCRKISQVLPQNSKVLLSVIPDPFFGLEQRRDLTLREFLPKGFPVDSGRYRQWMMQSDYIVVRGPHPSRVVWRVAKKQGRLIARVGAPFPDGYYAEIYRIKK